MSRYIPIAEIAGWLHPANSRWRPMALLSAYFDESGTHGGSTITAIAGYAGADKAWTDLEGLWAAELALLKDKGVNTFHMHDCIVGGGEYKRVDEFHRIAHIKRLSQILRDANIQAIGVWVDNVDWATMVDDTEFLKAFPAPYDLCFEHTVHFLRKWSIERVNGERVAPMFAYQPEYSPRTTNVYGAQTWYRDVLGPLAFDFPSRVPPLQTADFVAHQVRQDAHHIGYDELTLENIGFTVALANATARYGTDMIRGYDAGSLKATVARFKKTGKIL